MFKALSSFVFISLVFAVNCENDVANNEKSSLVFVIDDTGSMMDDITEVKSKVDSLFDAALKSNASLIEDFVIVTFNDPGVKYITTTRDRDVFKKALADIMVDGGDDCPEMALTGLELALQHSRNGSLVYLFTDAGAKDDVKYEAVKSLAIGMKCRLHFVLTGTCYSTNDENRGHRVYHDLAEATGGQVFNLFRREVGEFDVGVDDGVKSLLVSISGKDHDAEVIGPDGNKAATELVSLTSGAKVFKILDAKPGTYTVQQQGPGGASVVVTASKSEGGSSSKSEGGSSSKSEGGSSSKSEGGSSSKSEGGSSSKSEGGSSSKSEGGSSSAVPTDHVPEA